MRPFPLLAVSLLLPFSASAAITLDGPVAEMLCGTAANCPTWSQTFASNATHVVITTGFYSSAAAISDVTIGGVLTCTTVRANDGTHAATSVVLICPLTFTGTQTVAVTANTGPGGGWAVKVQSIIGAPTTGYLDGSATSVVLGTVGALSTTATTTVAGSWCFATQLFTNLGTGITHGAGETLLGTALTNTTSYIIDAAYKPDNAAGSVSQTTSFSGVVSGYASQAQACIRPISSGGSVVRKRVIVTGGV